MGFELHERPPFEPQPLLALDDWPPCPLELDLHQGACLSKPPLFCGMKYELWCIRMKFFVESIDRKKWNVITNNYLMPISGNVSFETEHLDCVAMNIIVSALDSNELRNVSECSYAKEMLNTLEEYYKNPRSALMEKQESSAESFSSESKKKGHIKTECPNKKKKNFKKHEKKGKSRSDFENLETHCKISSCK